MPLPRISLAELIAAIVVLSATLGAFRFAGEIVVNVAVCVVALAILFAAAEGVFDRGSARAAGAGFAFAAALYLALFTASSIRQDSTLLGFIRFNDPRIHGELSFSGCFLLTTSVVEPFARLVSVEHWEQTDTGETKTLTVDSEGNKYDQAGRPFDEHSPAVPRTWRRQDRFPEDRHLLGVAHCGWTLLIGWIGSLFARTAYERGRRRQDA